MISHCKNTLAYMCTHVGDRLIHPILCFSALKRVAWFQGVFDVVEDFCGSLEFVTTSFFVCTYVRTFVYLLSSYYVRFVLMSLIYVRSFTFHISCLF